MIILFLLLLLLLLLLASTKDELKQAHISEIKTLKQEWNESKSIELQEVRDDITSELAFKHAKDLDEAKSILSEKYENQITPLLEMKTKFESLTREIDGLKGNT